LTAQNTHARAHKEEEEKEEEEEDARRRRMSFYAAEERERQKREELSIGALPITPQKKGKKRIFSRKYAKSIAFALFLFSLEIHIE
jgi:hypothetical protein